jgi:hypothetical protein
MLHYREASVSGVDEYLLGEWFFTTILPTRDVGGEGHAPTRGADSVG